MADHSRCKEFFGPDVSVLITLFLWVFAAATLAAVWPLVWAADHLAFASGAAPDRGPAARHHWLRLSLDSSRLPFPPHLLVRFVSVRCAERRARRLAP